MVNEPFAASSGTCSSGWEAARSGKSPRPNSGGAAAHRGPWRAGHGAPGASELRARFRYAAATGRVERDPFGDLRGVLPPVRDQHHASLTDPKAIGELLRAIDGYRGSFVVKCPLVFVRPVELRSAEWLEIDFDKAEWRIPAEKCRCAIPISSPCPPKPWRSCANCNR
ncbi:MAG TPA: hypothetical protein VNL74_10355 [Methylococcus sp.]|nr:hypothetical protein [Methylococcus sp.]